MLNIIIKSWFAKNVNDGADNGLPTKEHGGYLKDRSAGLDFIMNAATKEKVEVSMFQLENGKFFVNP